MDFELAIANDIVIGKLRSEMKLQTFPMILARYEQFSFDFPFQKWMARAESGEGGETGNPFDARRRSISLGARIFFRSLINSCYSAAIQPIKVA